MTILNGNLKTVGNNNSTSSIDQCAKYKYKAYLTNTRPEYRFLFSTKTYKDKTKRIIELPTKATILVLDDNTGDALFYYVCYNGVEGYISKNLLIRN